VLLLDGWADFIIYRYFESITEFLKTARKHISAVNQHFVMTGTVQVIKDSRETGISHSGILCDDCTPTLISF